MSEKFKETKITRSLLYVLARRGHLNKTSMQQALQKSEIYPSRQFWLYSLDGFLLGLGIVFLLCGVIFFFAYNWAGIPKFAKLALVQVGIAAFATLVLVKKNYNLLSKMGLMAACVLVGAAFAVFGQIYQTGANAYDFFLWWTILISTWVWVGAFLPLWALYVFLINVTIVLYTGQVMGYWFEAYTFDILFVFNVLVLAIREYWAYLYEDLYKDRWFGRLVAMGALSIIVMVVVSGVWNHYTEGYLLANTLMFLGLGSGIYIYTFRIRDLFILSMIYLSLILMASAWMYRWLAYSDEYILTAFVTALFTIGATTLTVNHLLKISKKWQLEEEEAKPNELKS